MSNKGEFRFIGVEIPIELAGLAEWRASQYYGVESEPSVRQAFVQGYLQGRKESEREDRK